MYLTEEDHSGRDQTRSTTNALFITSPDIEVVAGTVSGGKGVVVVGMGVGEQW